MRKWLCVKFNIPKVRSLDGGYLLNDFDGLEPNDRGFESAIGRCIE